MIIKKRRPNCKTIEDVVLSNVGMTREEFLMPNKNYFINCMSEAITLLNIAAAKGELIYIVGDYDADGICSVSILSLTFEEKGWEYRTRLPRRFSEGFGLSEKIIDEIEGGLLITVDNGISASAAIKKAKEKGIKTIVIDHHLSDAENNIPDADVVIDPNAIANSAAFNGYCGAGLAYKLAVELLGETHPLIPKLLSLAAIATVADVMPLVEENRLIVKKGLATMLTPNGRTTGLSAILAECKQEKYFSAKNIAFKLAPMINAPGRMQDNGAEISYDILTFEGDYYDAVEKVTYLSGINKERREAKEYGMQVLHKNIEENNLQNANPLIVYEPNLPEGLVGIFAGQLAEEYKVPSFVLTDSDEEDVLKGSGRTSGNINIKQLLDRHSELMVKYGGHAEAAGISVAKAQLIDFQKALMEDMKEHPIISDDTVYFDLRIEANQIKDAIQHLEIFEPFGQGNPEVIFYINNFVIAEANYLSDGKTVKFKSGNGDAICFDMGEKYRNMGEPKVVDLIGTLSKNCYMNSVKNQVEVMEIIKPTTIRQRTPMAEMLAKMAESRN